MPNNTTLYLQAGGTKGATHAGALKEQQDNGSFVQPKTCCGTSAGALVGSLTAAGVAGDEILALLEATDLNKFSPANPAQNRRLFEAPLRKTIAMSVLHRLKDEKGDYKTPEASQAARSALMQQALKSDHEIVGPAGKASTIAKTLKGLFSSHTAMLETSKTGALADASFDELFALQERSFAEVRPGDTSEERANNLLIALEASIAPSGALAPEPVNITFADLKDLQELHPNQFSMLSTLAATKNNDPLISNHVFTPDEPIYAAAMNSGTAIGAFKPGVSSVKSDQDSQEEVFDGATVAELPVFIDPDTSQAALDFVNAENPALGNSDAHKREAMQKMYKDHISDGMDPEKHQNSEFFVFREQGNAMDQAMGVLDETVLSRTRQAGAADTSAAQIALETDEISGIQEPDDLATQAAFAVSRALPESSAFGTSITAEMYRENSTKTAQMLASCVSNSADPVAQRQRIMDFNTTGAVKGLVDPEAIGRLSEIGRQRAEHPPTPAEEVSGGLDSFIMMEDYFNAETPSDESESPQAGLDATREGSLSPVFRDPEDPDIGADLEESLQAAGSCIVEQSTTSQNHDTVQKTPSLGKADQNSKSSKNAPPASSTTPTPSM